MNDLCLVQSQYLCITELTAPRGGEHRSNVCYILKAVIVFNGAWTAFMVQLPFIYHNLVFL